MAQTRTNCKITEEQIKVSLQVLTPHYNVHCTAQVRLSNEKKFYSFIKSTNPIKC